MQRTGYETSKNAEYLYVGNHPTESGGSVTVYDTTTFQLAKTISDGVYGPIPLIGPDGSLYVSNVQNATVTVYNKSWKLVRTLKTGEFPSQMVFDSKGTLYVACQKSISVFPDASTSKQYTILIRPHGIAVDSADNLYVSASLRKINVYKAGSNKVSKRVTTGIYKPSFLATDSSGSNLYVVNESGAKCGSVSVFAYLLIHLSTLFPLQPVSVSRIG
jgi:DNA-binding beta-propeller fold protein YncE